MLTTTYDLQRKITHQGVKKTDTFEWTTGLRQELESERDRLFDASGSRSG